MMSCLLPQFKCPPDTFSIHFRTHSNLSHSTSKSREPLCYRPQCILSTTSPTTSTAVLDLEKLRLPSFDAHSDAGTSTSPCTYLGAIGPPKETTFEQMISPNTLITSDEAVIAAAAAEAVALARAAARVAKDAALFAKNFPSAEIDSTYVSSSTVDAFSSRLPKFTDSERACIIGDTKKPESVAKEDLSTQDSVEETDILEPTNEELELLEKRLADVIAVRSSRQTERKARRARASEKAAMNVVSVKSGSSTKKKRGAVQDVDYTDPLRYLRGTTSSSRLLTANEELELSAAIQDLLKLERLEKELANRYGNQPTFAQWAAAAGVDQRTLRRRLDHGRLCKDKMIKSNIRLVISIAKNYQGAGMNIQDLVQEGCRGLVRGCEKFDASKGFKFSTYAHWWIKQAVRKSLSDQSRTIRLPFHMVEATYRVKEARKQLYSETGKQPEDEKVAEAAGLTMKRLNAVLLTPKAPRSLDQKVGFNMDLKPSEVVFDPEAETAEDLLMKQFMKQDLEKVLNTLNPRETQVVRWRFGLEDGRMKTLQEIGEIMGISRERVRQIESSAFRKLKNKKRTKQLKQYVLA